MKYKIGAGPNTSRCTVDSLMRLPSISILSVKLILRVQNIQNVKIRWRHPGPGTPRISPHRCPLGVLLVVLGCIQRSISVACLSALGIAFLLWKGFWFCLGSFPRCSKDAEFVSPEFYRFQHPQQAGLALTTQMCSCFCSPVLCFLKTLMKSSMQSR